MSRHASSVPEAPPRSRREMAKAAQDVSDAVDRACASASSVSALLGGVLPTADDWEIALKTVVVALGGVDGLATLLRGERDALVRALSCGDPTGRPWRSQAYLARLSGVADSLINRIIRGA